jgi:pterin-4a-carbinolamine dehydratase
MTETLAEKTCTPCRGGVPPLARDEALRFQSQVPDWELRDEARRIERTFRFHNFREALAFVQRVGELAETEGHHPDINFGWGSGSALAAVSCSAGHLAAASWRMLRLSRDQNGGCVMANIVRFRVPSIHIRCRMTASFRRNPARSAKGLGPCDRYGLED